MKTYQFGYVDRSLVVFCEQFQGTGVQTAFQLTGGVVNATLDTGTWEADQVKTTLAANVTGTDFKPTYDSIIPLTRHKVGVSSISGGAEVTLDYPPRAGVTFYIWYWYDLAGEDLVDDYWRNEFVASMEAEASVSASSTLYDTDSSNILSLIWNEDDTVDRILNLYLNGASRNLYVYGDSYLNQDLRTTASPAFVALGISGQLTSTLVTGSPPFVITSTTKVSNLNVEQVDGLDAQTLTATSPITLSGTTSVLAAAGITVAHAATAGNIHLPSGGSENQLLKNSGVSGTGTWGTVTESSGALGAITTIGMSGQLTNTLAIGISPFAITSTTVNTNLNADLWDGYQFADYLDQAVKQASSPTFVTVKCTGLTDGYVPYHVSDAAGLANSPIFTDGAHVGIDVTPLYKFHVETADNFVLTGNDNQIYNSVTMNAGSLSAPASHSALNNIYSCATAKNGNTFTLRGIFNTLTLASGSDVTSAYGLNNVVTVSAGATVGTVQGMRNSVTYSSANAVTTLYTWLNNANINAGSVSSSIHLFNNALSVTGSTVTNIAAAAIAVSVLTHGATTAGGSTISNAYGYKVTLTNSGSGATTTTGYAFHATLSRTNGTFSTGYLYYGIASGTIGTLWGIFLTGETLNYLSGSLGLGVNPPTVKLDVAGAGKFTGQITSTLAEGTSPFAITSTTVNTNLNADLWDGYQFADYLDQAVKQASSPTFGNVTLSTAVIHLDGNSSAAIYVDDKDGSNNSYMYSIGAGTVYHFLVSYGTGATSIGWLVAQYGGTWGANATRIYHDGTDGVVSTGAGALNLTSATGWVTITNASDTGLSLSNGTQIIRASSDGHMKFQAQNNVFEFSGGITTSGQMTSTLATGTSPFAVTSTTVNTNLNADLWDGYQFADYLDQAVKQASSPTFVTVKCTGLPDGCIPYHVADATGLANSGIYATGTECQSNVNFGIGIAPTYALHVYADSAGKPGTGGLWTVVSDERIKKDIVPADLDRCYDIVKTIPLKRFTWAEGVYSEEQVKDRSCLGWVAQDVQPFLPKSVNTVKFTKAEKKVVGTEEWIDNSSGKPVLKIRDKVVQETIDDCLDLNAGQLIAVMYGAIQKLMHIVEDLSK